MADQPPQAWRVPTPPDRGDRLSLSAWRSAQQGRDDVWGRLARRTHPTLRSLVHNVVADTIDLHLDMIAAAMAEQARQLDALVAEVRRWRADADPFNLDLTADEVDHLRADNATLRDLLAKALPWVDPNESNDGHLLTVAITDALGDHRG